MKQLKIEYLSKQQLKPYVNNAKVHTKTQVEQIKNSIKEFDFNDPIAIWGDNEIVEGHGRLLAAMDLDEIEFLPVIRLDHLTDEQRKAYSLVHNKLTMNTDFDVDILNFELNDIVDIDMTEYGFDIDIENDSEQEFTEAKYDEKISVVIDCKNEDEAEQIFNDLTSEGYECHISTL